MIRCQENGSLWQTQWSDIDSNQITIRCALSVIIILFVRALKMSFNLKKNGIRNQLMTDCCFSYKLILDLAV